MIWFWVIFSMVLLVVIVRMLQQISALREAVISLEDKLEDAEADCSELRSIISEKDAKIADRDTNIKTTLAHVERLENLIGL